VNTVIKRKKKETNADFLNRAADRMAPGMTLELPQGNACRNCAPCGCPSYLEGVSALAMGLGGTCYNCGTVR
jgi:hypothetical protein